MEDKNKENELPPIENIGDVDINDFLDESRKYLKNSNSANQNTDRVKDDVTAKRRQLLIEKGGGSPTERYRAIVLEEGGEKVIYLIDLLSPGYQAAQEQADLTNSEIDISMKEEWITRVNPAQSLSIISESITNNTINYELILQWIRNSFPGSHSKIEDLRDDIDNYKPEPKKEVIVENKEVAKDDKLKALLHVANLTLAGKTDIRDDQQSDMLDFSNHLIDNISNL